MRKQLFKSLLANSVITRRAKNVLTRVALVGKFYSVMIIICVGNFLDPFFIQSWLQIGDFLLICPVLYKEESNKDIQVDLHPYYLVGLSDGEATFTISITKDNRERKTARRSNSSREIFSVHPSFAISLNIKDKDLIYSLQSYFGVGRIKQDIGNNAITYYVNSVKDLNNIIIPFFNKYPLITQKRADFILFKLAIELINDGAHLTEEGLTKVVSIKASMNKGLSSKLKTVFPNITPIDRPLISDQEIPNGNWVAGFADGESSFYVRIQEALTAKSRNRISFFFAIEQSIRDSSLMERLKEYLNCGTTSSNEKYIQYRVTKLEDIETKVIPFFLQYPLHSIKRLNFEDFCKIKELVESKSHLTIEGLEKIKNIKNGMNLRRK